MNSLSHSGQQLVEFARPFLEEQDGVGLAAATPRYWPTETLVQILRCDEPDTVKVAATCLGLIGTMDVCKLLAGALHHEDPIVVATVEDALWCIWFRAGGELASKRLREASNKVEASCLDQALAMLTALIADYPQFAEAHNQRAIAYYLSEQFAKSISDCQRTLALNPVHFGAMAGIGHCQANLGRYREALECYYAALRIHPRLEGMRRSIRHLRRILDTRDGALPA